MKKIEPNRIIIEFERDSYEIWVKFACNFDLPIDALTVETPTEGAQVYLIADESAIKGRLIRKELPAYPGLKFLAEGAEYEPPNNENGYRWEREGFFETRASERLINAIAHSPLLEAAPKGEPVVLSQNFGLSERQVNFCLKNAAEKDARQIARALKHAGGEKFYAKFAEKFENADQIWRECEAAPLLPLLKITHPEIAERQEAEFEEIAAAIAQANGEALNFEILPKIHNKNYGAVMIAKIAALLGAKIFELDGVRLSEAELKAALQPRGRFALYNSEEFQEYSQQNFVAEYEFRDVPEWCKKWIYVNAFNGFIDVTTGSVHDLTSFNLENNFRVPMPRKGKKPSAFGWVAENGFVRKVDSVYYAPQEPERFIHDGARLSWNIFNPLTVPKAAGRVSEEGARAYQRILQHIEYLVGEKRAPLFTDWIAHQVQFPGKKLQWNPLIQSVEGTGKSYLGLLLKAILGNENVGIVSPDSVIEKYNGYALGRCVNILEEIRISGENRHQILNKLKPALSDDVVNIRKMNTNAFEAPNTTNYLIFTNFKDAIPLDDGARRWWIIFCEFNSIQELEQRVGVNLEREYYPRLFDDLGRYAAEIRRLFLEREISEIFRTTRRAPRTAEFDLMVSTEKTKFAGLAELEEIIEAGGEFITKTVVSSKHLFQKLEAIQEARKEYLGITPKEKNNLMQKLGFMSFGKQIWLKGEVLRVWVKNAIPENEIKEILTTSCDFS